VIRPWLGIKATLLSEEVINLFTMPLAHGWLVEDIEEGSPAEKAGLLAGDLNVTIEGVPWVLGGDIIQDVNGEDVRTVQQHAKTLKKLKIGDVVELSIVRNGTPGKILATVHERPRAQALDSKVKGQDEMTGPPIERQGGEVRKASRAIRF
jgi:S1-C subfamily serine protease